MTEEQPAVQAQGGETKKVSRIVCNCSCCKKERWIDFYYYITLRLPPDKTTAAALFEPKALQKSRPGLTIASGGKFESLNFEPGITLGVAKNIEDESFMYVYLLAIRYLLFILIGVLVGMVGSGLEASMLLLSCYKNSTLRQWAQKEFENNYMILLLKTLGLNLPSALIGSLIVVYFRPQAAGGGIAGILGHLNGVNVVSLLDFDVLFVKSLSVVCMSVANLPGGKEGPMIHIGSIIASSLPRMQIPYTRKYLFPYFINDTERRDFISAGVAAGLAAAFGTPIGGMLMALEEYVYHWNPNMAFKVFICSFSSATTFNYVNAWARGHKGRFSRNSILFLQEVTEYDTYALRLHEIPIYLGIGIMGGLIGSLWVLIHKYMDKFRKKFLALRPLQVLEVIVWSAAVNVFDVVFLVVFPGMCSNKPLHYAIKVKCPLRGISVYDLKLRCTDDSDFATAGIFAYQELSESYDCLFHPDLKYIHPLPLLAYFLYYYFMSALFSGSSIAAGVYVPNLYTGAMFGRLVASLFAKTTEGSPTRYAFVGSGSLLTGVIRLTYSLAAIMAEGSSNTIIFIPLLLTLIITRLIGDLLMPNVYEVQYSNAKIPLLGRIAPPLNLNAKLRDVMASPVVCLTTNTTVKRLVEVAFETRHNGFPIVDPSFTSKVDELTSTGRLEGLILRSNILIILKNLWFQDIPPEADTVKKQIFYFRKDYTDIISKNVSGTTKPNPGTNIDLTNYVNFYPSRFSMNGSVNRAYKHFIAIGLRHLIVINVSNEVVGIITRKDLARFKRTESLRGVTINRKVFA